MKLTPFTIADCRLPIERTSSPSACRNVLPTSCRPGRAFDCRQDVGSTLAPNRQSSIINRQFQRGMALIITLILLSVTLVMAVAFLALSHRERNAVTTATETTLARQAAETALAQAQAQIVAGIYNSPGAAYNFGLLVSTNFINNNGFVSGVTNVLNVNYDFKTNNGGALTADDRELNIGNLWLLPRPPVFVTTNGLAGNNGLDFRFWLDLNQNGKFDTNGFQPQFGRNGLFIHPDGTLDAIPANVLTNFMTGDPEWIGVLERPDLPHGPNNKFLSRYAFFAVPSGNTLDLNAIHNQAITKEVNAANGTVPAGGDGYFRNQSVGSWELNLAAFLADLNTNSWNNNSAPYTYLQPISFPNTGSAFDDARALLSYRYDFAYNTLATANNLFANPLNYYPFNVDGYSDGPLQITLNTNLAGLSRSDDLSKLWVGANNTNRYFALTADLLDKTKVQRNINFGFTDRLRAAGTNPATYDRYTFYRLQAQLGTDSTADEGKLNLNYSNAVVQYNLNGMATNIAIISGAETNLVPWRALDFFTAAADKMLRLYTTNWFQRDPTNYLATYYGIYTNQIYAPIDRATGYGLTNFIVGTNKVPAFGVTRIPVYINSNFVYSAAINRVLQQAANIYDARTNSFYPSVFRPLFLVTNNGVFNDVYVVGYTNITEVSGYDDHRLNIPTNVTDLAGLTPGYYIDVNVYGVPWIIGAKKGFPNFNKFGMQTVVDITRKLQVRRAQVPTDGYPSVLISTNQLYAFTISNTIGVNCWNSYASNYPNSVYINVRDTLSMWITNDYGAPPIYFNNYLMGTNFVVANPPWYGFNSASSDAAVIAKSFAVPFRRTTVLLPDSDFYFGGNLGFQPDYLNLGWETNRTTFDLPRFGLLTTNRFQLSMLDYSNGVYHVIDYVQLAGPDRIRDLNAMFQTDLTSQNYDNMWSTNVYSSGSPYGVQNQWDASRGQIPLNTTYWKRPTHASASPAEEIAGFCKFLGIADPSGLTLNSGSAVSQYYSSNLVVQLPYTPTATIYDYTGWQANDPLVHYLASDLNNIGNEDGNNLEPGIHKLNDNATLPVPKYTVVNDRYQPWGINKMPTGNGSFNSGYDTNAYNLTYKDPLVWRSDFWDFPTNAYPSVGWLGRVHRGTPWQTVYLKAHNILKNADHGTGTGTNSWVFWTGDTQLAYGQFFDAANMGPLQDRLLFDMFTTRLNDNAAHGTLSVNQTNLAAWSAVFGGMVALSNNLARPHAGDRVSTTNFFINPAGVDVQNSAIWQIFTNINASRAAFVNPNGVTGTFGHIGDILSTPILTESSPFLNTNIVTRGVSEQLKHGISDEVYEWLPQQTLGLLRCPTDPRYTIYCFGQTLKPAPDGMVLSGPFFKMITNYQVVAESASRAVLQVHPQVTTNRFGAAVTNYTTTLENFNPLEPN